MQAARTEKTSTQHQKRPGDAVATTAFDLPDHLAAKTDPALIAADDQHFAAINDALEATIADLTDRLAAERKAPGGSGQTALERDQQIHRLSARLRTLRRFGLDLCLGHMVSADDPEPVYIGRLGLTDADGRRLLIDWRSPAAGPFFSATHADPDGLVSRRRYRWTLGRITDYWDEAFTPEGMRGHAAALDDQSAFIASLGATRSATMRDVLGTLQADQDAIIRAGSRGALVVDGGPGTGKTVVALHRAAYLLYSDPRLKKHRGGVLFVGPHEPYLAYVSDVLPSLGEDGVQTATLADLVPGGRKAAAEADPEVAELKASADMIAAIEAAIRFSEQPPKTTTVVSSHELDVTIGPRDWASAFAAPEPGTLHNDARDQIVEALATIVLDSGGAGEEATEEGVRAALLADIELQETLNDAWPMLDAADLVADLWSVPAYLRHCAPWLTPEQVRALQRDDPHAWTVSDLPLLDAARRRLGDPQASARNRRREAEVAAIREHMDTVIDHLVASDDSEMQVMTMLRGDDLLGALDDEDAPPASSVDLLAGPFLHIVVDEAQELTDAQWQMLLARCPSRSFTIVGDRAQARHGFAESWHERLTRIGLGRIRHATLGINYRTPSEVMEQAEPVIRRVLPDANVPTSIRSTGRPVEHAAITDLGGILGDWLAQAGEGVACVIATSEAIDRLRAGVGPECAATSRIKWLTPELAKGLEFDLVVLAEPATFGEGIEGAVDTYVAMTRATQRLVLLESP